VNEKSEINQSYCQLALAFQTVTEELVIGVIKRAYSKYKSPNLCLAGGVALNCVANNKIEKLELFENIWIHPAAGDAGGALGCALAYDSFVRKPFENYPRLKHAYLGPSFSDKQIKAALTKAKIDYQIFETDDLLSYVSKELFQGKIVGWFQGKMEWGPRALGNRSILADPSAIDMQKKSQP
jgi:carbamoyltransferase